MTTINHALLIELNALLDASGAHDIIELWRKKMGKDNSNCEDCPYEQMMGRRCCCMCLESSLSETSLRLHVCTNENDRIKAVRTTIKSHRSDHCCQCKLAKA